MLITGFVCKIIKSQRCQPLEISNLEISDQRAPPPPLRSSLPIRPPYPHRVISREKRGSIYQWLQVVDYSSNQALAYIGVTKKKLSSICLQRTTCITQENEARNRNTSIRSYTILEFWNIWSLNLSFLWATDPNFLLTGGFWSPVRESGRLPLYPRELASMKT